MSVKNFPYQPNWDSNVQITFGYETAETVARKGISQRTALRSIPRLSWQFSYLVSEETGNLIHTLKNQQTSAFRIANFSIEHRILTTTGFGFNVTSKVPDDESWDLESIAIGDFIFVTNPNGDGGFAEVTNVTDTTHNGDPTKSISYTSPISTSNGLNKLHKAYIAMPAINAISQITDQIQEITVTWNEITITTYQPSTDENVTLTCQEPDCQICPIDFETDMYFRPCDNLDLDWNDSGSQRPRPALRARDIGMPDEVKLTFQADLLFEDTTHTHTGNLNNLKTLLGGTWSLPIVHNYIFDPNSSRHWHHVNLRNGSTWTATNPTCARGLFRVIEEYVGDDGETYELEIRFVTELNIGLGFDSAGCWGTLFHVFVFSDEIAEYTDGTQHGDGYTYYRDDPCVYDQSDLTNLHFHPQLALVGHIPTTIQSPCGFEAMSPFDKEDGKLPCNTLESGVPWMGNSTTAATLNSLFGSNNINTNRLKALTVGGDCIRSVLPNLVTLENGTSGKGYTAFYASHIGWDDADGGLTATSAVIYQPACLTVLPEDDHNCCTGHPSALIEGTDQCWAPASGASHDCCYKLTSPLHVELEDRCHVIATTVDGACVGQDIVHSCGCAKRRTLSFEPYDVDYRYGDGETQNLRYFQWRYREPNPNYSSKSFEDDFNDNNLNGWTQTAGIWVAASEQVAFAVPGANDVKGYLRYNLDQFTDFEASFLVTDVDSAAGFLFRTSTVASSLDGYMFQINVTDDLLEFYTVSNGTLTLEESTEITATLEDDYTVDITVQECTFTLEITNKGEDEPDQTFEVVDKTYVSGGYLGLGNTVNEIQIYDDVVVVDNDFTWVEGIITFDGGWDIEIPAEMMPLFGEDSGDGCCVSDETCCACVEVARSIVEDGIDLDENDCHVQAPGEPHNCTPCATEPDDLNEPCNTFVSARVRIGSGEPCDTAGDNEADKWCAGFDVIYHNCLAKEGEDGGDEG